jgi:hypothetical protein
MELLLFQLTMNKGSFAFVYFVFNIVGNFCSQAEGRFALLLQLLNNILLKQMKCYKVIYNVASFHKLCDGKKNNIALLKPMFDGSNQQCSIGGFLDAPWHSNRGYNKSEMAFI